MKRCQIVRSKLKKTRTLQKDKQISEFIPATITYGYNNLQEMLSRFPLIFIKPDQGSKGFKVAAVKKHFGGFSVHFNSQELKMKTLDEVSEFFKEYSQGKKFLIQQGIDVLKVDDRPFNLRIWVQKPHQTWKVTGITAVLAAPNKLITNYQQGGTLLSFERVMSKTAGNDMNKVKELTNQLLYIGKHASEVLNQRYKGLRELGIDIGIDQSFWPWILEVNTKPMIIIGNPQIRRYHSIIKGKYRKKKLKQPENN